MKENFILDSKEHAVMVAKQIDAYKRFKRSLINEVVTGKRKVA